MKCSNCKKEMKDFSSRAKPSRLKYMCERKFNQDRESEDYGDPLPDTGCGHVLNMRNEPWHEAREKARAKKPEEGNKPE